MRVWRAKVFNNPLHRVDRTFKNANKVIAALRRKRDQTGKFNYEQDNLQSPPLLSLKNGLVDSQRSGVQEGDVFLISKVGAAPLFQNWESMPCNDALSPILQLELSPMAQPRRITTSLRDLGSCFSGYAQVKSHAASLGEDILL
jgi:hypothetical protein